MSLRRQIMATRKLPPHGKTDIEIDRRTYRERTLVLIEDRAVKMMLPDGTSKQYILAVESTSKEGNRYLGHKRYISRLIVKNGYDTAKEGAMAIFLHPGDFKSILGEDWFPFVRLNKTMEAAL